MTRSHLPARMPDVRRPMPTVVALLVVLAQVAACQPETGPETGGPSPIQRGDTSPNQPPDTTPVRTSPFSLAASAREPDSDPQKPDYHTFTGVLTTDSLLGYLDFRYDAYVVTAQEYGEVLIQSDVLDANPEGYRYGYGYPLSMTVIEDGVSLTHVGHYLQNALDTGIAVISHPVVKGQQYILVYKTFGAFTPLTYQITLPTFMTVEGRIHRLPEPQPVPPDIGGLITLQNQRPESLGHFVDWLTPRISSH